MQILRFEKIKEDIGWILTYPKVNIDRDLITIYGDAEKILNLLSSGSDNAAVIVSSHYFSRHGATLTLSEKLSSSTVYRLNMDIFKIPITLNNDILKSIFNEIPDKIYLM